MDDKETIIYKSKVTEAKLIVYDKESANRIEEIKSRLLPILFLEAEKVERLVYELACVLGAGSHPEPGSVMHLQMSGSGLPSSIAFDPLNLLTINLVADRVRAAGVWHGSDLPEDMAAVAAADLAADD